MGENSFVADVNFKLHFLLDATIFKQLMMRKKGKKINSSSFFDRLF